MVRLSFFFKFVNKFSIWVWIEILSVDVGLFVIIRFGFNVKVWVIVICCFWLLDKRVGLIVVVECGSFMCESSLYICFFCLCGCRILWIFIGFFKIFNIFICGFNVVVGFWKIIEIWWLKCLRVFELLYFICKLLNFIVFEVGFKRLIIIFVRVDLL